MSNEEDDLLNVDNSPKTVSRKARKAGKRVNSIPIAIILIAIAIFVGFAILGVIKRMEPEPGSGGGAVNKRASAIQSADDFLVKTRGMIPAKQPDPPPIPEPPKAAPEPVVITQYVPISAKPDLPAKTEPQPKPEPPPPPEPVKVDPNIERIRQQRLAKAEQAIASRMVIHQGKVAESRTPVEANALTARSARIGAPVETAENASRTDDLSATGQFDGASSRWKSKGEVEAPSSPYLLRTGFVIPAVLISGLNSELPGQIIAQVSQHVYDTATGMHLLVPQGSRLIGEYLSNVKYGQSRVFAVWQRIVFPDGKTIDLGAMPASTGAGYAGLKDRVNNHYFRIFGSALMMSAVIAGVELSQEDNGSTGDKQRMGDAMSAALGNTFGTVLTEMIRKNMSIAPTIEIRPGFRLNVMLVKDLEFKSPYRAFDYIQR